MDDDLEDSHMEGPGPSGTDFHRCQGRIDRLEVDNFKSYKGHQQIGPFKPFTAIIGPNGSGKSNLMDAISFVLGVRTQQLRGSLKELLYSHTDPTAAAATGAAGPSNRAAAAPDPADRPRKGGVKLVYVTEDGEEVHFSRLIQPVGSEPDVTYQSAYKINNKSVTWEAYAAKLGSFGILVKVRNFLVFQGDIEKVASRSPEGLTALFESIAGSDVLKKDYEAAEAAKARAEERCSVLFAKKKGINAEKRTKKEQKDEAEKFMKEQDELKEQRAYLFLFQLYHIARDAAAAREAKATAQEELDDKAQQHASYDSQISERKKQQAGLIKERMLVEKKMKKAASDKEKKAPALVRVREEASRLSQRIKKEEKELEAARKKAAEHDKVVAKLEADLKRVTDAKAQLEADEAGVAGKSLKLSAADQEQYQKLKEEVAVKTSKATSERDTLLAQQKADEQQLSQLRDAVQQATQKADALRAQREEAAQKLGSSKEELMAARKELKDKSAQQTQIGNESRRINSQRDYVTKKLSDVEEGLSNARATKRQTERDKRIAEAAAMLKRDVPGVYGRITDLGKITQRKYNLPMAIALGQNLDAVVVDTKATGFKCIDLLKDQRRERMDFIPLDSCSVKPINERLRQLGGTAKLAFDLVDFDRSLERAFLYACGNTLVCETKEEARALAFDGDERHKVVALDGTLFKPNGTLTGGTSANMDARAGRWDDKAIDALREERDALRQQLQELPDAREAQQAVAKLALDISELEARAKFAEADVKLNSDKIARLDGEIRALEAQAATHSPQVAALQKAVTERGKRLDALSKRIDEVADRYFADFSKRHGIKSIRAWEAERAALAERSAGQRLELDTQAAKIRSQLSYERSNDPSAAVTAKEKALQTDRARAQALAKQEQEAAAAASAFEEQGEQLQQEMEELGKKVQAVEAELTSIKKAAATFAADTAKLKRALTTAEAALEQQAARQREVLEAAALQQVQLPLKDGGSVDPMELDGAVEAAADGAGPSNRASEAEEGVLGCETLDFDLLTRKHREARQPKDRQAAAAALTAEVEAKAAELEKSAPNLKAVEQYDAIREEEKKQNEALEAARKDATAAIKAFNRLRNQRETLFNSAFDHIRNSIDTIYKHLTRSSHHPLGGTAYLSLERDDEPYLAGIKYTAMPPTKRFRDMEALSGGEKTVAALALLFAIHSYRPSPFFVLDEVDAALDATNVARVAHYIRARTRDQQQQQQQGGGRGGSSGRDAAGGGGQDQDGVGFQSIVISLKDIFYEKADALVGVSRDTTANCSKTITFDLDRFAPPTADA